MHIHVCSGTSMYVYKHRYTCVYIHIHLALLGTSFLGILHIRHRIRMCTWFCDVRPLKSLIVLDFECFLLLLMSLTLTNTVFFQKKIVVILYYVCRITCMPWNFYGDVCYLSILGISLSLDSWYCGTEWRRPIWCLKLQVIFCKRATNYRTLLQKMTCKDKASYGSSPPCMYHWNLTWLTHTWRFFVERMSLKNFHDIACTVVLYLFVSGVTRACGTWLLHMGHDMTHAYGTWLIQMWRDSFIAAGNTRFLNECTSVLDNGIYICIYIYLYLYLCIYLYQYLYLQATLVRTSVACRSLLQIIVSFIGLFCKRDL